MSSKTINYIFALITIAAVAVAVFVYYSRRPTQSSTPDATPSETVTALPTVLSSPSATPEAVLTPQPNRAFTESQGLSLPNLVEQISEGGSLYAISAKHSVTLNELAKLNGISNPDHVTVGQSIIIPDDTANDTYILLFVTNPKRLAKEKQKIASGATSLYSDPVTSAQTDLKNIYGLIADTPWSKTISGPTGQENVAVLSTSYDNKLVTADLSKNADGFWLVKKMVIKLTPTASPTPL